MHGYFFFFCGRLCSQQLGTQARRCLGTTGQLEGGELVTACSQWYGLVCQRRPEPVSAWLLTRRLKASRQGAVDAGGAQLVVRPPAGRVRLLTDVTSSMADRQLLII